MIQGSTAPVMAWPLWCLRAVRKPLASLWRSVHPSGNLPPYSQTNHQLSGISSATCSVWTCSQATDSGPTAGKLPLAVAAPASPGVPACLLLLTLHWEMEQTLGHDVPSWWSCTAWAAFISCSFFILQLVQKSIARKILNCPKRIRRGKWPMACGLHNIPQYGLFWLLLLFTICCLFY